MPPRVHAPELAPARAWLNTSRPLTLAELRGQVVILDFWTYCCVNCMHVLPVLHELERRRRADPVVVIGVHSAKFVTEAEPERVRGALARLGVVHPVVVDDDMAIWTRYGVRSWPTLVVLRPDGTLAGVAPGEVELERLDAFVGEVLAEGRRDRTLADAPFPLDPIRHVSHGSLRFPAKVAVAPDGRVAIADTGNHRVVLCGPDGAVEAVYGDGLPGLVDGPAPRFHAPHGLAFGDGVLWVADTRNHALRRIDLVAGHTATVAGTGRMGQGYVSGAQPPRRTDLRSPWDVVAIGDDVVVAMAGTHQIFLYDAGEERIGPIAGSGREDLVDGTFPEAAFAQPSGLALDFPVLYVADSETSAVRRVDFATGRVSTLVGAGLFEFGDDDGGPEVARLQHATGVTVAPDGRVVVADTYNDALRVVDPTTGDTSTLYRGEGERALREPEGVAMLPDGSLLVADTNHHRLVRVGLDGAWLGEWTVRGLAEVALLPRFGD